MGMPMRWEAAEEPIASPVETRLPHRVPRRRNRGRQILFLAGVLGLMTTFGAGTRLVWNTLTPAPELALNAPASPGAKVTLNGAAIARRIGYVTVTGSVQNKMASDLPRVEAVIELLDGQNHTVKMESALVAFNPLPKGQDAPFEVVLPDDSRAVAYRVRFKQLDGPALN